MTGWSNTITSFTGEAGASGAGNARSVGPASPEMKDYPADAEGDDGDVYDHPRDNEMLMSPVQKLHGNSYGWGGRPRSGATATHLALPTRKLICLPDIPSWSSRRQST